MFMEYIMPVQSISKLNFGTAIKTKKVLSNDNKQILIPSDTLELRRERQQKREKRRKQILGGLAILTAVLFLVEFHRARQGKDTIFNSSYDNSDNYDVIYYPVYVEEAL